MINKKIIALSIAAAVSLTFASCGGKNEEKKEAKGNMKQEMQIANPIKEYKNMEDLRKAVDYEFYIPSIKEYTMEKLAAIDGEMINIVYTNEDATMNFRASQKHKNTDGDYTKYEKQECLEINGVEINVRINGEKIYVANWSRSGINYSIASTEGINKSMLKDIISE